MTKVERIESYLYNFFNNNIFDLELFYIYTSKDRRNEFTGIYRLERGNEILDFIFTMHSIIKDDLNFKRLIPDRFVDADELLQFLINFKKIILEKDELFDEANLNENTDYVILTTIKYKNKILRAIEQCLQMFDLEDEKSLLYQKLRYHLIVSDIESFIEALRSILSSVSYAIIKHTEGYYHANVYLILKLLGFDILSEETTNIGRIDCVINFSSKIYILEFKFSKDSDDCEKAFNQIIEKNYASKYRIYQKEIYGIGISFNENIRNIKGYKYDRI
ncbi:hypothetical protein B0A56_12240 [Flavobacterium columnare NBRC 100251 = ATCC 23463]|nr:hypothetical protein B0A56_12240 [Flavobacterium columnare NBRC 100251 = ATCC 23463]